MRLAVESLNTWVVLGIVGLGAILAFAFIIGGAMLGNRAEKAVSYTAGFAAGIVLAVASVLVALNWSGAVQNSVVRHNTVALTAAAKATYGVALSERQAMLLIGTDSKGRGVNRLATVQDSAAAVGTATLEQAGQLTPVALYNVDGVYRLYFQNPLRELPRA